MCACVCEREPYVCIHFLGRWVVKWLYVNTFVSIRHRNMSWQRYPFLLDCQSKLDAKYWCVCVCVCVCVCMCVCVCVCVKRARRSEVNFLPNFPRGEDQATLEQTRLQILEEVEKTEKNQLLIEK